MTNNSMLSENERAALHKILARDPIWTAYALADLQPEFDPYCHWYRAEDGIVLIFTGLEPPILLTVGPSAAVGKALKKAVLPDQVYVSTRIEHLPLVEALYDLSDDARPMLRMALQDTAVINAVAIDTETRSMVVRLTRKDEKEIDTLLQIGGPFTPDGYDPFQLENGVFFGIRGERGELLAMGGTHIVDWQQGIGTIGNMYTHPAHRGRGYGSTILQEVVATLLQQDVSNIVLNVDQRNAGAQRIYKRLGFVEHCPFMEGSGQKIDN